MRRSENAKFLEQFRYCIIASQLLNDHVNSTAYNRRASLPPPPAPRVGDEEDHKINVSLLGLGSTAGAAFILVWSIHWSRSRVSRGWGVFLVLSVSSLLALVGFVFLRRQQLHSIRHQVIEQASSLVTNSQSVDAATSAAFSLIQEVELVSRGYRMYVEGSPSCCLTNPVAEAIPFRLFHAWRTKAKPVDVLGCAAF